MKTYLSIDIDYWLHWDSNVYPIMMNRVFNQVINSGIPIYIVKDHEELVNNIDKFDWTHLINVDSHSDIVNCAEVNEIIWEHYAEIWKHKLDFNCGTWANFCKNRHKGTFIWQYPVDSSYWKDGFCHSGVGEQSDPEYLWDNPNAHNWKRACAKKGISVKWDTVVACGIALSHEWLPEDLFDYFVREVYPKLVKAGGKASEALRRYLIEVIEKEDRIDNYYKKYA